MDPLDDVDCYAPICIASTAVDDGSSPSERGSDADGHFCGADWSADGTCLLTRSAGEVLRTYVLPTDLLDAATTHYLTPYSSFTAAASIHATAAYPLFSLADPSTAVLLAGLRDHPIQLINALNGSVVSSYKWINPLTEAYIPPSSLLWKPDGVHFLAGSKSQISLFDAHRPSEEAVSTWRTSPSKHYKTIGSSMRLSGTVTSMALSADGVLAAGTWTRSVGLYDAEGAGGIVSLINLKNDQGFDGREENIGGGGVSQVEWSPDGRYLYIAERQSNGLVAYDIRYAGRRLGVLTGRAAHTLQRMKFQVLPTPDGHEIWAGGTTGRVSVWKDPGSTDGSKPPTFGFEAHRDAVPAAVAHPTADVLATVSGQRHDSWALRRYDSTGIDGSCDEASEKADFSVKIWSL